MIADWIAAARPKTLPAAVVPVAVGAAEAHRMGYFDWWPVSICLAFALLVQIATNMGNDYYDHVRGADKSDRIGPERLVASGRIAPRRMLIASFVIFALAFAIGLALVAYRGWELLVLGILSITFGYGYTGGPFPLAYRGLGDVFVILFFGLVATMGTVYVVSGELTGASAMLGLALGLLANNILVVNNYRDRETDRRAQKMTLVARYGLRFGRRQYWAQLILAYLSLLVYCFMIEAYWPLLPVLALPLGIALAGRLGRTQGEALNALLARSALFVLLFGLLLATGTYLA